MTRLPKFAKPVALVLLTLLLPGACALAGNQRPADDSGQGQAEANGLWQYQSDYVDLDQPKEITGPTINGGAMLPGNYLSARHAQSVRDMSQAVKFINKSMELSPTTHDLVRRAFVLLASEGRMDEAVPLARKMLEHNSADPIASLVLIVEDLKKARFKKASAAIDALPDGGLNRFMVPLLGAWSAIAQDHSADQGLAILKPLMKDGSKPLYYLHKAMILDLTGDPAGAVTSYEDQIEAQGGATLRVIQLLGNLHRRMGDDDKAEALYRDFNKTNPNSPIIRHGLKQLNTGGPVRPLIATAQDGAAEGLLGIATTFSQQNARETALIFARMGLHLRPNLPILQILLGNILQLDDQLASANEVYKSIDRASPYSWPARLRVAENLDDLEQTSQSIKALNALADEEPDLSGPLTRLGDTLRSHERFEEAVLAYDRAFERIGTLQRRHWSLLYARGIVLERSKQWKRAEADFLKALELEPEQPFVLNYLGYSWVDQGKNLDKAKDMIRRAVDLRPSDGYIVDSLGWAHYRLGEFDLSVTEMERAVELTPQDPVLNDHLGDAYWRVGRKIEARYQWQRVMTLKPDDELRDKVKIKQANGLPDL